MIHAVVHWNFHPAKLELDHINRSYNEILNLVITTNLGLVTTVKYESEIKK